MNCQSQVSPLSMMVYFALLNHPPHINVVKINMYFIDPSYCLTPIMLNCLRFDPSNFVSIHTEPCQRASTKEECESLARKQDLSDWNATVVNHLGFASGCFYMPKNDKGDRLYFNTASARKTTESPTTDDRRHICKNGVFPKKSTGYEWWERKQDGMIFLGNEVYYTFP